MQKEKTNHYSILILSLVIILGVVLSTGCSIPKIVEDTHSYKIAPGEQEVVTIELEVNEKVDLTVEVIDDQSNTSTPQESKNIGIQVVNPSGLYTVSYMRVGRGDFMVLAEKAGTHTITLDNRYSSVPKSIDLTIKHRD